MQVEITKQKTTFCVTFSKRIKLCSGSREAEGPLDVQTGKRLMKGWIDRCVDSCGLSELSRSHSDRVFKGNNRKTDEIQLQQGK